MYYTAGDGEDVPPVCARTGSAVAAEPRDWLPEGHLAFFVSDLVEQLDLSAILRVYEDDERGYPPYHPVMLTKVLVYG